MSKVGELNMDEVRAEVEKQDGVTAQA